VIVVTIAVIGVAALTTTFVWRRANTDRNTVVTGVVLAFDADPHKQRPIPNAVVYAEYGETTGQAKSDGTGFFRLNIAGVIAPGEPFRLRCEHPDFKPFATVAAAGDQIQVIRLKPRPQAAGLEPGESQATIGNVRVRYATKATNTVNVASIVRTFDILNKGNVPCAGKQPCSPDGKWKASLGTFSINTGEEGKYFRNVRVSCIAGPCPFTEIEKDGFSRGGQAISVVVRNWSDRVTYLLEAEVAQTVQSELIRHAYPVIFGRSMNFTLPASSQGPSIEAEVNGAGIVFPLGPKLRLSWATCTDEAGSDGARLFQCQLKPGFRFQ